MRPSNPPYSVGLKLAMTQIRGALHSVLAWLPAPPLFGGERPPLRNLHFAAAGTACPDKSTASTVFLVIKLACVRVSLGIFLPSAASIAR